jgi:phosphorylcholine metabolism protein LicD
MNWNNENGKKLLLEVAGILDGQEIPFFLMQGTALGAYRDGGFTPTEADIDLGILQENLGPIARGLINRLVLEQFQVETYCLPFQQCRTIVAWKYGIHVDLVGFIRWKDKRFTHSPYHPSVRKHYAIVHDAAMLENYRTIKLFGREFNAPENIEEYLKREYGAEWRVPMKDHISRTRIYDYVEQEGIPHDLLASQP